MWYNSNPNILKALKAAGGDFYNTEGDNKNPLMEGFKRNAPAEDIKNFLGVLEDVNKKDRDGNTPANYFTKYGGGQEKVKALIDANVDFSITNESKQTLLMEGIKNETLDENSMINLISAMDKDKINAKDDNDETAAHYFARYGVNNSVLDELKKKGVDFDMENKNGQTPLMLAKSEDVLASFIEVMGNDKIEKKDGNGNTAIHYLMENSCSEFMLDKLEKKEVNLSILNNFDQTL